MLQASGACCGAITASARGLLSCASVPCTATHLHDSYVCTDEVWQHQAQNEQQARKPHVSHRIQQLHKAARDAAAAGGAVHVAGPGSGVPVPPRAGAGQRAALPSGAVAPAARQLRRTPRDPLIESLLFYERDARRDLFFYFPRGRPAPPAACDIRTIFHNFLYSRSLRRCVNLIDRSNNN